MDFNLLSQFLAQFGRLWHKLLPSPCLWCNLPVHSSGNQLCDCCLQALPQLPYQLCHFNLLWLPHVARGLKKPRFDALLSVGYYHQPYQHWLQRWKFQQDYGAGELLQQQFAVVLSQYKAQCPQLPDAIVYVPMHRARQRKRGFNQAELLAQTAAKVLDIPLLPLLQRSGQQQAQVGLSRRQRQANLRHAFALAPNDGVPARLALVDDVITTGATANEICRLLRRHGVLHISLWTIAVTLAN